MLRAAIVGLGAWGRRLVNSAQGSDRIRFVAAATRTVEASAGFARERGFPLYADYRKVLEDPDIDAVVLATPHSLHAQHVVEAADAGKHVYVEKPFTLDRASAQEAVAACRRARVTLAVGLNRRFRTAVAELRRLVTGNALGQVLHIEGSHHGPLAVARSVEHWRSQRSETPGGGMTAKGVHVLDLMVSMVGHVRSINALCERRVSAADVDDVTAMTLRFTSGVSGYLSTVLSTAHFWRLHVLGARGWAEVRDERILTTCETGGKPRMIEYPENDSVRAALEAFAEAATGGEPYPVTCEDAVNSAAAIEAVVRSAATKAEVVLAQSE
jgi:predicted dehydrogenase